MREQIVAAVLTETLEATSLPAYFCPARGRSPARLQNLRQPRGTWRWMLACRAVGPWDLKRTVQAAIPSGSSLKATAKLTWRPPRGPRLLVCSLAAA